MFNNVCCRINPYIEIMTKIIIEIPFEKDGFIKANILRWNLNNKKNKKQALNTLIGGVVVFVLGLIAKCDDGENNPLMFIGGFLIVATLFIVFVKFTVRKKYLNKIKNLAEKYKARTMNYTYELTNEYISYTDPEKQIVLKWSLFTYYTVYKDILVLVYEDSFANSFFINREDMSSVKYDQVISLVKEKLKYSDI